MKSPINFVCPLTRQIMWDPVTASDGNDYERTAIQEMFRLGNFVSPVTNEILDSTNLISNYSLAEKIDNYLTSWLKNLNDNVNDSMDDNIMDYDRTLRI